MMTPEPWAVPWASSAVMATTLDDTDLAVAVQFGDEASACCTGPGVTPPPGCEADAAVVGCASPPIRVAAYVPPEDRRAASTATETSSRRGDVRCPGRVAPGHRTAPPARPAPTGGGGAAGPYGAFWGCAAVGTGVVGEPSPAGSTVVVPRWGVYHCGAVHSGWPELCGVCGLLVVHGRPCSFVLDCLHPTSSRWAVAGQRLGVRCASRTTNVAPPPGVSATPTRPRWPATIAATIARPRPVPPPAPRPAGGVGAEEPLEHLGRDVRRDAGSVVADLEAGLTRVDAHRDLDRRAGGRVPHRVREEVGDDLPQPRLRPAHDRGLDPADEADERDAPLRFARPGVGDGVGRQHREVDVGVLVLRLLVEPGEHQQVLDEGAHPVRLGLDPLHRGADRLGVAHRPLPVQLGVAAHGRQRGAQLVRGVGDELAHPVLAGLPDREGRLDLGEHDVEAVGERGDLVVGLAFRDALGQVALRRSPPRCPRCGAAGGRPAAPRSARARARARGPPCR